MLALFRKHPRGGEVQNDVILDNSGGPAFHRARLCDRGVPAFRDPEQISCVSRHRLAVFSTEPIKSK